MSQLNQLLDSFTPPPVPEGLGAARGARLPASSRRSVVR
jgi:hypothetical protein